MSTQFAQRLRAYGLLKLAAFAFLFLFARTTDAHVGLDSPNGGESLDGGSELAIEWHVEIQHNTLGWDLWYSTESDNGPWEEIVLGLDAGDKTDGAQHTFNWNLPNLDIPNAWVRVRQDNAGQDYFDVSDSSFSIVAELLGGGDFTGDGTVDAADLMSWQQGYGAASGASPSDGDANLDGDVDGADFLAWQTDFSATGTVASAQSVPEPAATALLVLGMLFLLWQRR